MLVSFINIVWTLLWHDFANHVTFAPGHRNLHLCFLSVILNTDWAMSEHSFHWTTGRHCSIVGISVALLGNVLLVSTSTFSLAAIAKRYYALLIHVFSVWIITLHEKIVLINVAAMALQFFIFCVKYLIQSFVGQQWQNNHYTIRYDI